MVKHVILVSGYISTGKSTLAQGLADRYDMSIFKKMPGPWFKFRKKDGLVIGEDVGFCQELQMAGYKIFVDTSVPSSHLTTIAIDRRMNKLWEQMKLRQAAALENAKANKQKQFRR